MELLHKLLAGLFPSQCILCRKTVATSAVNGSIDICQDCLSALPLNSHCCWRCALPLADDVSGNVLCGRCIKKLPAFDYCYCPFRYEQQIISLVHQLKFAEKTVCARTMGELLLSAFQHALLPQQGMPECLLPVPLHNKRLRQRGFNQSTEIVRLIRRKHKLPIVYDSVVRQRNTGSQTRLVAEQRRRNVKGAFRMAAALNYRHVLIVDDVVTTGSTVNELASLLKRNGVERVGVLGFARAPLP